MIDERLIQILCMQQWEKCKGELRALIALQGSVLSKYEGNQVVENRVWKQLEGRVEHFIEDVECSGLAE